jgi:hypothetical protein
MGALLSIRIASASCVLQSATPEQICGQVFRVVKASRQHVLDKASDELNARPPLGAPGVGDAVFPAKGHIGLDHADNPCVADCRANALPRLSGLYQGAGVRQRYGPRVALTGQLTDFLIQLLD